MKLKMSDLVGRDCRARRMGLGLAGAILLGSMTIGWTASSGSISANPVADVSFRNELQRAIDRGLTWLQANQNTNGYWWSTPDHPAVTALALMAFKGDPQKRVCPSRWRNLIGMNQVGQYFKAVNNPRSGPAEVGRAVGGVDPPRLNGR